METETIINLPKIIIFGTNLQAATLWKMITQEEQAVVEAFIIDKEYRKCDEFQGLPVVNSEDMVEKFPPSKYKVCLSFAYKNMVHNRRNIFNKCKDMGYEIYTFISKNAMVYTDDIGEGANIYPGVLLAPFVKVGTGSFIDFGCVIAHHSEIGDFNYMAPGVRFCGDISTGSNCFFGAASMVNNGCKLSKEVFVSSNAKVTKNVKERGVVLTSKLKMQLDSFDVMKMMFKDS